MMYPVDSAIPKEAASFMQIDVAAMKYWLATDASDFAQSICEMFRPFIDQLQLYGFVADFGYGDHRHIMRRKIWICYSETKLRRG